MTLKYKMDSLEGLSEEIKGMYQEKDGVFYLQAEGLPQGEDVTGLKNKIDELLKEKKAEQDKTRVEAEKRRQTEEDAAREKGDFEALSKSYEQKIQALEEQIKERDERFSKKEVERQALLIASDLAEGANQEILSTFIERRLRMDGDEIKVTDDKGNLTISTIDQLKEEFRNNPKFGALVIASKATGGGASENNGTGGAGTKKYSEMSEQERTNLYNSDRDEFNRLREAENL